MRQGLGGIKTLFRGRGDRAVPEILSQTPHSFPRSLLPPPSPGAGLNSRACGEHKGELRFLNGPSALNAHWGEASPIFGGGWTRGPQPALSAERARRALRAEKNTIGAAEPRAGPGAPLHSASVGMWGLTPNCPAFMPPPGFSREARVL